MGEEQLGVSVGKGTVVVFHSGESLLLHFNIMVPSDSANKTDEYHGSYTFIEISGCDKPWVTGQWSYRVKFKT